LGFIWSFLNPLLLIAVYALVFKYYIRFNEIEHYSLFVFAGLLPWIWFSTGLLEATASISSGGNLITKAMFPPHVLPTVSVLTNLANFLFAVPLLLIVMLVSNVPITFSLLALPLVILIELIFMLGLSFGFAALNVHFRDVQHVLGSSMTLLFFLCPILYAASGVPERFQFTFQYNPIAIFTQMYHQIFLEATIPPLSLLGNMFMVALLTFFVGNAIFNNYREDFAELV